MRNSSYAEDFNHYNSVDQFAEALGTLPVPWQIKRGYRGFSASIEKRGVPSLSIGAVCFDPCRAERHPLATSQGGTDYVCLTFQRAGSQTLKFEDGCATLMPNELMLWDGSKSMELENSVPARTYNVWFPTHLAERRVGNIAEFLGKRVAADSSSSRILCQHIEMIYNELAQFQDTAQASILDATIELIFACIRNCDTHRHSNTRTVELFKKAKKEIDSFSDLSEVTPGDISHNMGISKRYLQQIFSESGLTFSHYVAEVRLNRATQALKSSHFNSYTITEIASWFGFYDAPHFNRIFKKRYGTTPSQYRRDKQR